MKKFFLFIFLIIFGTFNVKAYTSDYFSIDIPNNYNLIDINDKYTYKWIDKNNYIMVTISDNLTNNYNVCNFSNNDIVNQKEYIEKNMNIFFKDYDINYDINSIDKDVINNECCLKYSSFLPSSKIIGYDTYQIGYILTSDKYIISLVFSSDNKIDNSTTIDSIINSFKINDKVDNNYSFKHFVLIISIIICFSSLFKVIYDIQKRN